MAITQVTGTLASASTGPVTPTIPTHAAGDLILVFAYQRITSTAMTISGATGYTSISVSASTTYGSVGVWYKKAASSSETNPTVNGSTSANLSMGAIVVVLSGANADAPMDVAGAVLDFTAPTTPFDVTSTAVTTLTNGAWVFHLFGSNDDNTWTRQTTGWTDHLTGAAGNITAGDNVALAVYSKEQATAGSSGALVSRQTNVAGDNGRTVRFAIKPAGATTHQGLATVTAQSTLTAAATRRVVCQGTWYATSFPSTLDGWTSYAGASPTWDGTEGHDALGALKVVLATNGGGWGVTRTGNVNSIRWGAGESFTASCWVKGTLTGGALRFYVQYWNAANGIISTTTVGTDVTKAQLDGGGWWQITGTGTTPANTVRSTLIVVITTTDTGTFWVDDVQLVQTPQLTAQSNLTPAGTRRAAAAAQLAGDGTMTAAGTRGQQAAAALAGDGSMAAAAGGVQYGDATLSAQTSLTAAGTRTHQAAATVSAQTSMTAAATHTQEATAQLSGQASMVAAATRRVSGAVEQLAGASSCTAAGVRTQPATAALAGDGSATAAGTARGPYASIDVEVQGDAVTADLDSDGSGVSVQGGASGLGS